MTLALSIRQPWCWAILFAGKDIENRDWPTKVRGRVLIHASKGMTREEWADCYYTTRVICPGIETIPEASGLERGGIVGEVEIIDCVTESDSPWFFGKYGFVLRNAKPLPFRPYKGRLGFFEVNEDALYREVLTKEST